MAASAALDSAASYRWTSGDPSPTVTRPCAAKNTAALHSMGLTRPWRRCQPQSKAAMTSPAATARRPRPMPESTQYAIHGPKPRRILTMLTELTLNVDSVNTLL